MSGPVDKIKSWWANRPTPVFSAPLDTITTRFMILFLVMLIIPLMTVIFFSASLIEEQLSSNARIQILMSDNLLQNKLQERFNQLSARLRQADKSNTACHNTGEAFCLVLNPRDTLLPLPNQKTLPRSAFEARSPGLLEKLELLHDPQGFYALWSERLYLMSAAPIADGRVIITGMPFSNALLGEIFRETPGLSSEVWLIREPVNATEPLWLARAGNTALELPIASVLQQLPALPSVEPRKLQNVSSNLMVAQQFLYGADNQKLARLVHVLPMDPQRLLMQRYFGGIYVITVISLLLAVMVAFGAGRTITQPLLKLIQQVNQVNRDNVTQGEVVVNGVHEIRQLGEAFNRMLNRLQQEHKMKDEFVATLTHDLKVPLLAEKQTLEYFLRGTYGPLSEEQREIMDAMRSANLSGLGLVNGLLQAYRYASGEVVLSRTPVPILPLAEEVLQELQALAREKDITLSLNNTLNNANTELYADRLELKRVFHNLISNAITNTPRRGKVRVCLADAASFGSEQVYKVSALQHTTLRLPMSLAGRVLISVEDSGIGFATEDLPKLFKQFAAGQGRNPMSIGLGLYNCNQAIEAHNGSLWVETTEGEGSAVCFLLPQSLEVAADRRKIAVDRRNP